MCVVSHTLSWPGEVERWRFSTSLCVVKVQERRRFCSWQNPRARGVEMLAQCETLKTGMTTSTERERERVRKKYSTVLLLTLHLRRGYEKKKSILGSVRLSLHITSIVCRDRSRRYFYRLGRRAEKEFSEGPQLRMNFGGSVRHVADTRRASWLPADDSLQLPNPQPFSHQDHRSHLKWFWDVMVVTMQYFGKHGKQTV